MFIIKRGQMLRYLLPLFILIIGVFISLMLWDLGKAWRDYRNQSTLDAQAVRYAMNIETELTRLETVMMILRSYMVVNPDPDPDDFSRFVSPFYTEFDALHGIFWFPRVVGEDRAQFEKTMSRTIPDFIIWEVDEERRPVKSLEKECYYPLVFSDLPCEGYSIIGFDTSSIPAMKDVLNRSFYSDQFILSPPEHFTYNEYDSQGVAFVLPLYHTDSVRAPPLRDRLSHLWEESFLLMI